MRRLISLYEKNVRRVVGLMSGTSVDGIDAALIEVDRGHVRLLGFVTVPYTEPERARIFSLFEGGIGARGVALGSFWLGERFAQAALRVIAEAGLGPTDIDLIGSHGQTVWHEPPSMVAPGHDVATLQIGEPAVIAARTGLPTVGDFRVADVALGGEGAPLVPFADWLLFARPGQLRALQNIGGIANVTAVTEARDDVRAFDCGPGNMMLDALAPAASGGLDTVDRDGRYSAVGTAQPDLVAALLDDDFLRTPPPRSTGRERYGADATLTWATQHADRRPVDLLATLVAFAATAIADSYRFFPRPPDEVLVSGGGAHNATLMRELAARVRCPVRRLDEDPAAIPGDAKEAVAFALMAIEALFARPANLPLVTGARGPAILGKICWP